MRTNGDVYHGAWVNDKPNGMGRYTRTGANGDVYVGEWVNGERTGMGTFTRANGNGYVGEWKDIFTIKRLY